MAEESDARGLVILHQDEDWLLVNKPAQQLVHPTRPDGARTLIDVVREAFPGETLAIINRLDRETSGLVLISRHSEAASLLGKMTMARQIRKRYQAIVQGAAVPGASIHARLGRLADRGQSRIFVKQGVLEAGATAVTRFRRLDSRRDGAGRVFSLLELELETGRLHQIRAHLRYVNLPVLGDKLYGPDDQCYLDFIEQGWTAGLAEKLLHPRQALHASQVEFDWKGNLVRVNCPLPEDLQEFWDGLRLAA
ncbi:MAG: RluA family pseudouridine synthase [Blastochloris sp.]|nr:RluA family pseudouridine synthase [Blastochloris sp.]